MNVVRIAALATAVMLTLIAGTEQVRCEYKIGPGDILQVSFWQKPALDQTVTVRKDGMITISIVGEIVAGGLTPAELGRKIGERANYRDPAISQAAVTVLAYNSQKIFISGEVSKPGTYSFEVLPNVWEFIIEAGGVNEAADLSKVTLIRGSEDAGKIETINLERLVSSGEVDKIPKLHPGDIVEVPSMPGGINGPGLPKTSRERRNVAYVTGAILRSGPVNLEEGMDVLDAIVLAGGPTPAADLRKVKVVSKHETYSSVMTIDLDKYTSEGTPRRYVLKPEDTVVLPMRKTGFLREGWGTIRDVIAVTATVVSTIVLVDQIGTR